MRHWSSPTVRCWKGKSKLKVVYIDGFEVAFSENQWKVIIGASYGLTNKDIAKKLHVTESHIKNVFRGIFDRLGFDTRIQVALWYMSRRDNHFSLNNQYGVPNTQTQEIVMESREIVTPDASSSAVLHMSTVVKQEGKVHSKFIFQNFRRKENCHCSGCTRWEMVQIGILEDIYPVESMQCENQYLAWEENADNIVVTVGKNDMLTQYFKGSSYTAAWFIGLVDGGSSPTYAAGDTAASHAGWTENTGYSQATRPAWTGGTASAGSIDNSASVGVYSINAGGTIAGAFSITNSTKGGTSGTIYSEVNFSGGSRAVLSGDTLNVTQIFTVS